MDLARRMHVVGLLAVAAMMTWLSVAGTAWAQNSTVDFDVPILNDTFIKRVSRTHLDPNAVTVTYYEASVGNNGELRVPLVETRDFSLPEPPGPNCNAKVSVFQRGIPGPDGVVSVGQASMATIHRGVTAVGAFMKSTVFLVESTAAVAGGGGGGGGSWDRAQLATHAEKDVIRANGRDFVRLVYKFGLPAIDIERTEKGGSQEIGPINPRTGKHTALVWVDSPFVQGVANDVAVGKNGGNDVKLATGDRFDYGLELRAVNYTNCETPAGREPNTGYWRVDWGNSFAIGVAATAATSMGSQQSVSIGIPDPPQNPSFKRLPKFNNDTQFWEVPR